MIHDSHQHNDSKKNSQLNGQIYYYIALAAMMDAKVGAKVETECDSKSRTGTVDISTMDGV